MLIKPKIAIVGASIAGSVCATILHRLGFDITVFEKTKSSDAMVDRGAGIWLPEALIQQLIAAKLLSLHFPYIRISERPIYTYNQTYDQLRLLTSHPVRATAVNWLSLYEDLKKHRPENLIIYDAPVTGVTNKADTVALKIKEQQYTFDYCLFTDGIHSFGRQALFPNMQPNFTKTIIWRGILDNPDSATIQTLLGKAAFYVCERGHLLLYLIPTKNYSPTNQDYKVNWLFYEKVDHTHSLFHGNLEAARQNVIKGSMSAPYHDYLKQAAKQYFSAFPRQIILATEQPFIQAVHEMLLPTYNVDHIALIGDAGISLRPHAAVGATKAIQDAFALGTQLQNHSDVATAFQAWNKSQYAFGRGQFKLGQALGKLFVTHMPDWQNISTATIDAQWQKVSNQICWYAD